MKEGGENGHPSNPNPISFEPRIGGRILCVGLICLDVMNYVPQFPAEDSDNRCEQQWSVGGNAANNCSIFTQLGDDFRIFAALANDYTLPFIRQELTAQGIDLEKCMIRESSLLPASCAIINQVNGSRTILHSPNSLREPTLEEFSLLINIEDYSWIHFEGRNFVEVRKMMDYVLNFRVCRNCDTPIVSVEIEKRRDEIDNLIAGADYVFLSKDYARSRGFSDMIAAVNGVAAKAPLGTFCVICAWGDQGACARSSDGQVIYADAFHPPAIVDTLGAGDTFVAATIHSLNKGDTLQQALAFGCRVAGSKCGQRGLKKLRF